MISGVINVYKESGFTSHDVVAKLRGIVRQKKIGHTGTLDPDAVGVLPVCFGRATRLAETLASGTKTYEAVLLLGTETDTQDAAGNVVRTQDVRCTKEEIRSCLSGFLGIQEQIPPMYSAKKQNGKHLYELARKGITVERRPSRICVESLEILGCDLPRVNLRVTCSRGTYIRTLCHDIGNRLGCGGCMEHLVRTRVGSFHIRDSVTLEEIRALYEKGELDKVLIRPDVFFETLPAVYASAQSDSLLHNGNPLPCGKTAGDSVRVYDSEQRFMGVYHRRNPGDLYYPEFFFYEKE